MLRLRVAEYFDSVVNEIDLFTETKIQSIKTQAEEDWWNKRRQEQIDEVRRIERACLDHVNTLKVEEKEIESGEWMKRAFVEYCFTVEFDGLLYLAKANRFVEPREKRILDIHLNQEKIGNLAINSNQSLDMTVKEFEVNLRDNFLTDAPVIDISSGLDKCCRIKRARISDTYVTQQNPICFDIEDLTIKECTLDFYLRSAGEEKEALDVIKCFMTRRLHISMTITIDLQYFGDQDPSQDMKALVQSIELDDRVKFVFYKRKAYFQEFDLPGLLEKYKGRRNYLVKVINWHFISEISFYNVSLEDLENVDFSSLHSLTYLHLKMLSTGKSSSDWKFLDACRSSLDQFIIESYLPTTPVYFSCRTFRGMTKLNSLELSGRLSVDSDGQDELFADLTLLESLSIHLSPIPFVLSRKILSGMVNLKSLSLSGLFFLHTESQEELFADLTQLEKLKIDSCHCTTPFPLSRKTFCTMTNLRELRFRGPVALETNNQEELFADLIHLKKLDIKLDEQMMATKWFIHSPTVENLSLTFFESLKIPTTQIRFSLPKLASLELSFYCDTIECDLTDMMSCFSHVKNLKITSRCYDTMTKGWFNRLTSVEKLELDLSCGGHINSQLLQEFGHLTKLKINIFPTNTLDRCLLHKLVHLESVSFVDYRDKNNPLDTEDKSMFDGLNSLKSIEHIYSYPCSRDYVYFENLGRYLWVVN